MFFMVEPSIFLHAFWLFRYINLACIFKSNEVAFKLATSFVGERL
jgi:hypothetical protein